GLVGKIRKPKSPLKLVDEPSDEGFPVEEPVELSLKEQAERTQGPTRLVVVREPDSGRIQPLPDLQGKGKTKVIDEQAAHDLLTLLTSKNKSPVDQFIFQRRTPMPTKASRPAESPSLDTELALTDSETEFNDVVPKINTGDQDEGQARPDPGVQDEGQAGSNPGDARKSQPQSSHVVHARPNLEYIDLEATDALTQQNPEQMDKEFTTTACLNVQENLKLPSKDQAHEDYKKLYDALENSLERDYTDQLLSDLEEARQKKRKRRDLTKTPFGSPLPQPPPPPPPLPDAGVFETQELSPTDSLIQDDSIPDEQTIPSSNVSDVENNWANALVLTYEIPAENSLLVKTGDMTNFLNWYCRQVNKTKLTQADLERQAYEVVKAFYQDVIHLQF
nr:hypothetical protein [Tanacetum cinerariifolium]